VPILSGAAYPLIKVFIKKTQRKGMVTVVIVLCAVEFDKVKAKSLLAGKKQRS
jgi:hypothetical protein